MTRYLSRAADSTSICLLGYARRDDRLVEPVGDLGMRRRSGSRRAHDLERQGAIRCGATAEPLRDAPILTKRHLRRLALKNANSPDVWREIEWTIPANQPERPNPVKADRVDLIQSWRAYLDVGRVPASLRASLA